ncbi:MAG: hypothetical protein ACREQY_15200 [Candidatus Binatia bacterium]
MRTKKRKSWPEVVLPDRVCREQSVVDMILDCWLPIATVAWEGFLQLGRGSVHLRPVDGSWSMRYAPGFPPRAYRKLVEEYDPAKQAVVVILGDRPDDHVSVHLADGWPPPPEAMAVTTADEIGKTVH